MSTFRLLVLIATIPVVAAVASSSWAASAMLRVCHPRIAEIDTREDEELGHRLDAIDFELRRQIQIKEVLLGELIEGRAALADVATQFLAMNRNSPASMGVIRKEYPGETDEEKSAYNVLTFANAELSRGCPVRKAEVLARLDGEFEALFGHHPAAAPSQSVEQ
ncbi:unnamed protein product [Gemmataceae bacterium]|nr:unnamed protein product [Gemmataceae bacterium]VTT97167.1 unnamed protein product [Gemmataceae bacterium]